MLCQVNGKSSTTLLVLNQSRIVKSLANVTNLKEFCCACNNIFCLVAASLFTSFRPNSIWTMNNFKLIVKIKIKKGVVLEQKFLIILIKVCRC